MEVARTGSKHRQGSQLETSDLSHARLTFEDVAWGLLHRRRAERMALDWLDRARTRMEPDQSALGNDSPDDNRIFEGIFRACMEAFDLFANGWSPELLKKEEFLKLAILRLRFKRWAQHVLNANLVGMDKQMGYLLRELTAVIKSALRTSEFVGVLSSPLSHERLDEVIQKVHVVSERYDWSDLARGPPTDEWEFNLGEMRDFIENLHEKLLKLEAMPHRGSSQLLLDDATVDVIQLFGELYAARPHDDLHAHVDELKSAAQLADPVLKETLEIALTMHDDLGYPTSGISQRIHNTLGPEAVFRAAAFIRQVTEFGASDDAHESLGEERMVATPGDTDAVQDREGDDHSADPEASDGVPLRSKVAPRWMYQCNDCRYRNYRKADMKRHRRLKHPKGLQDGYTTIDRGTQGPFNASNQSQLGNSEGKMEGGERGQE